MMLTKGACPRTLVSCRAEVGEGPTYDARTNTLLWVDIPRGRLWRWEAAGGRVEFRDIGEPIGSVALIEGGGFLLATRSGLLLLRGWDDTPAMWHRVEPDLPTQFNDGKCDSRARFIAGTAAPDRSCAGTLYRIDHDGSAQALVRNVGMSNGLDWSPDDRFFYYVDSLAQTVFRYDWDAQTGVPHDPVSFIEVPGREGLPDGLTVDSDGYLWLAVWGAGQVRRYDPTGRAAGVVELPTPNVSSCTFGGPALNELYITTATLNAARCEQAGNVFVAETTARGQRRTSFPRRSLPFYFTATQATGQKP